MHKNHPLWDALEPDQPGPMPRAITVALGRRRLARRARRAGAGLACLLVLAMVSWFAFPNSGPTRPTSPLPVATPMAHAGPRFGPDSVLVLRVALFIDEPAGPSGGRANPSQTDASILALRQGGIGGIEVEPLGRVEQPPDGGR